MEEYPIIPQAARAPAFPVFRDSAFPPFPRSSVPLWTTTDLPRIEFSPNRVRYGSHTHPLEAPSSLMAMLPKSPKWRSKSSGAPWCVPFGLKWLPAEMQPLVSSPNWWTWNPFKELASLPTISQLILVNASGEACSK